MIRSVRLPLLVVLLAGSLAGCLACRPSSVPMKLEERFIADTRSAIPESPVAIYQRDPVLTWKFEKPEDLAGWRALDLDLKYELNGDRGLLMQSSKADSCLWRPVDLLAEEIDEIQIVRSPLTGGSVQVFWQGDEPTFTAENSVTAWVPDPGGKLIQTFTFRLRGHPHWKGKIRYLRFDLTEMPTHRVALYSIEAFRYRLDSAQLAQAVAAPLKVDFDNREVLAQLAPPGLPWGRDLEIGKDARLTFTYGLQQRMGPPVTFEVRFESKDGAGNGGPPLFSAQLDPAKEARVWRDGAVELGPLAGREGKLIFETKADASYDPLRGFPLWGNPELAAPGKTGKWNLVFIVVDTLRRDRLSLYGYSRDTSPRLDAWAADHAAVFEQAIAPAPWTLPSHVSMFTGLGPLRHGVNYNLPAPASLDMLPEHLRQHGYSTLAVTGGAFVRPSFGLSQGFDRFVYFRDPEEKKSPSAGKDLATTLKTAEDFLAHRPAEPFFLFFHTYEVHAPYVAHAPYFEDFYGGALPPAVEAIATQPVDPSPASSWQQSSRFVVSGPGQKLSPYAEEQKQLLDALYDSGVRATDEAIGKLLAQLEELGLAKRTVVLITSDHGESLGEHGAAGHYNLYDNNLRVPLVISWPDGRGRGQRIDTQVRLIDLAATLTESLGVPPLRETEGQSLLPLLGDPKAPFPREAESVASSANQGISLRVGGRQKLIYQHSVWPGAHGRQELYDLAADPGELHDLSAADPVRAAALLGELERRFVEKTGNLVVEASNQEDFPLEFHLRGAIAHAFTAKAFTLPEGAFEWRGGEVRVKVPPRSRLRFYLEGHAQGELLTRHFDPRQDPPAESLAEVLTVTGLDQARSFRFGGGAWQPGSAGKLGEGESGVSYRWNGQRRLSAADAVPAVDAELRRQLEALGYVN